MLRLTAAAAAAIGRLIFVGGCVSRWLAFGAGLLLGHRRVEKERAPVQLRTCERASRPRRTSC
jgi:hypothetical protein